MAQDPHVFQQHPLPPQQMPATANASSEGSGATGGGSKKTDYIGRLLNLISKQEIRYEGTLVQINSQDQTLLLKNVKSYGSEGRRGKGTSEIQPSSQVYKHIIFKASELKDFYVVKSPAEEFQDPAIVSGTFPDAEQPAPQPAPEPGREVRLAQEEVKAADFQYAFERRARGQREWGRRSRGGPRNPRPSFTEREQVEDGFEEDYDFEKMNALFQAGLQLEQPQMVQPIIEASAKYDKSKSFYDGLSGSKSDSQSRAVPGRDSEGDGEGGGYRQHYSRGEYGRGYGRRYHRGYGNDYRRHGEYNAQGGEYRYRTRGPRYRRAI